MAYWDTSQPGQRPRLLGDFQGTPTLRLFKPKKKQRQPESNAEKSVVDYRHGERTAKDMRNFIEDQMPNYSMRVTFGEKDLHKALAKAQKFGIPVALMFTSKPKTSPLIKFLSTEFRRKILLVEIPPTTNNQDLLNEYGLSDKEETSLPALLVIPPKYVGSSESKDHVIKYDGDKFTRRKLQDFMSKHALKTPVYKPKEDAEGGGGGEAKPDPIHSEF